jgi:HKD family nuclease
MRTIKNPSYDLIFSLINNSKKTIKITSPFIKENVVNSLFKNINNSISISLITSFKLMNYYLKVSDLSALELILNLNGTISNFQKLHSKIYIFDDEVAIITSGNLTNGGLLTNYEYGVLIEEEQYLKNIVFDFNLLLNHELTGEIFATEINQAKDIIAKAPKHNKIVLPEVQKENQFEDIEIFTGGTDSITSSLNGWKLEVFKCLLKISNSKFTLGDIYNFIPYLQRTFPENKNLEAKIRQQLQILRDIGLVEFLGQGSYKKLWI